MRGRMEFNNLPDEILLLFFIRLPTKSIARCKCVAKRWRSLISESVSSPSTAMLSSVALARPYTTLLYSGHSSFRVHPQNISIHDSETHLDAHMFSLRFLPGVQRGFEFLASCDDLILCDTNDRYLFNLFTKQYPWLRKYRLRCYGSGTLVGLLHDRMIELSLRVNNSDNSIVQASVFSFRTRLTRTSDITSFACNFSPQYKYRREYCTHKGVALAGKLHWICADGLLVYDPDETGTRAEFGLIEYPVEVGDEDSLKTNQGMFNFLGLCRGKLRMSEFLPRGYMYWTEDGHEKEIRRVLRIWELDDEKKWCLKHKAFLLDFACDDDGTVLGEKYKDVKLPWILFVVRGFHPLDGDIVYLQLEHELVSCNLRLRKLGFIQIPKNRPSAYLTVLPIQHPWSPTPLPLPL